MSLVPLLIRIALSVVSLCCQRLSASLKLVMAANSADDGCSEEEPSTKNDSNHMSLARVLKIFTSSISEEQAWAICHQCSKCFLNANSKLNGYRILVKHRLYGLHIQKDGEVVIKTPEINRNKKEDNNSYTPEEHISESGNVFIYFLSPL